MALTDFWQRGMFVGLEPMHGCDAFEIQNSKNLKKKVQSDLCIHA
jgi:hypothetical protein